MPRYELRDGTSAKFWSIEHDPKYKSLTTTWGKLGTAGQTKKQKFAKPHLCSAALHEQVHEKLGKGYRIATGLPHVETNVKRNPELEAAIAEAPAERERWSVYADWLQEAGDPRGEHIALHLGKKKQRAKAYAQKHRDELWGDARYLVAKKPFAGRMWEGWDDEPVEYEHLDVSFGYSPSGFVQAAGFSGLDEYGHIAGAVADLLASPLGMFVEALNFGIGEGFEGSSGQPNYGFVAQAIGAAAPQALRQLRFFPEGYQRSWTATGDLTHMLANVPRLEVLEIALGEITLGKQLDLPHLRLLSLLTGGLDAKNVRAIAAASWPSLEDLRLYFGRDRYGGNATIKDVRALLANSYPKLTKLALCNSEHMQSKIAAEVFASKLVKQLTKLDLSQGTLIDTDVPVILAGMARLPKLVLDVQENYLSPAAEKQLNKARVNTLGQRYGEMIDEQRQYGQEKWAIESKTTFRYSAIGE